MMEIKAIVRDGQFEVTEPLGLPNGTEVTLTVRADDDDRIESTDEIEDWIRWLSSLEPLEFTPEERAAIKKGREEQKLFDLAQADERIRMLSRRFP